MKSLAHKGFTLIEFVVIISIFAIMAGVALVNFAGFRSNVGLNNLAHDIALTIRQAQVFGWATSTDIGANHMIQLDPLSGDPKRFADGVFFGYSNGTFEKNFILYTKTDSTRGGEFYVDTPGIADVTKDSITIQGPYHIVAVRYADTKDGLQLGVEHMIPAGLGTITDSLSIAFSRPHPEALFFAGSLALTSPEYNYIALYIAGETDGDEVAQHVIIISRLGEITVQ